MAWAQKFFGSDNVVAATCHTDESTCHVHLTAIPLDDTPRKKGTRIRLNAARWLDGKKKLQAMQDSFADAMKPLGLERGHRGSKARHQEIQKYYGQMKELPALKIKYGAAKGIIKDSNEQNQEAYHQGRIDQAKKDAGLIQSLRKRAKTLLRALKWVRASRNNAIGILDRGLDNAVGRSISSNIANDIGGD